jgi:flagellar biosynthetic protein FliO
VTAGRIKLVLVLAGLVLAGGLLPVAGRLMAAPSQEQANLETNSPPAIPDQSLKPQVTGSELRLPDNRAPVGGSEYFYKMLLSVLLVIALGIAVVYVSKKILPRFTNLPGKQIRVLETTHLSPRKGLHLIEVGTHRLLIASTNESITMLADVTEGQGNFAAELEARSQPEK